MVYIVIRDEFNSEGKRSGRRVRVFEDMDDAYDDVIIDLEHLIKTDDEYPRFRNLVRTIMSGEDNLDRYNQLEELYESLSQNDEDFFMFDILESEIY